jgi:hypothetical protein
MIKDNIRSLTLNELEGMLDTEPVLAEDSCIVSKCWFPPIKHVYPTGQSISATLRIWPEVNIL